MIGDDPVTCFPDDFPGTVWFRFQAGIKSTVVTAQSTDFKLDAPDSFRQDTTAALSTTNTAIDAAGKEVKVTTTPFVEFDVAYDAPLANCPKDTIQTVDDLTNADTSGCLNLVGHTARSTSAVDSTSSPRTGRCLTRAARTSRSHMTAHRSTSAPWSDCRAA